jgi:glyoxylase-like metal-dependent hydrolase (beta-lactamase superfamily II)
MLSTGKIARRTWLQRTGSGALALWAGLQFGSGREGWGILLGTPRPAAAQDELDIHRVSIDFPVPPDAPPNAPRLNVAAYILVRGNEVAIVDTLTEGHADLISQAVADAGMSWGDVKHVILTHRHPDHVGSAAAVSDLATAATFWTGALDLPKIELPRPLQPLSDGDEVFGLQMIHTPGHTIGHMSVYDPVGSTLISGDALFNVGGTLAVSPPDFSEDVDAAVASARKLATFSYERLLVMHGVVIESGGSAAVQQLAATLQTPAAPAPAAPAAPSAAQAPAAQSPAVQVPGK